MTKRKVLILFAIASFVLLVGVSIYAVLTYSQEELQQQSLETIQSSEGRDNHHAVGENVRIQDVSAVLNADEDLASRIEDNEVTVVNFFASWCDPCRRETPDLNRYHLDNSSETVEIIGINVDDSDSNRDQFLEEFDVQYPIYEFDDEDAAIDEYEINLMPTTFFVDESGEVIRAYVGEISPEMVTDYINYVKEVS